MYVNGVNAKRILCAIE